MARLLLVDDNPSIHKIAETLLGSSYVELVCVESAEAALALIEGGATFDIALVDTTMPGMDGWSLLDRLRANPSTSRIPIAMMAGVLDTIDPDKLASAPIQGFLKKPIELRDLPDRVRQLLATPVSGTAAFKIPEIPEPMPAPVPMPEFVPTLPEVPELNPYATQPPGIRLPPFAPEDIPIDPSELETQPPGTKLSDLPGLLGSMDPGDLITLPPGTKLSDLPGLTDPPGFAKAPILGGLELDLLLLTPEDFLDEAPAPTLMVAPAAALIPEVELDLEELDLDSLRGLPVGPASSLPRPAVEAIPASPPEPEPGPEPDAEFPLGWPPMEDSAVAPFGQDEFDRPMADAAMTPEATVSAATPAWGTLPEDSAPTVPPADFPLELPDLGTSGSGFEVVSGEVIGVPTPAFPASTAELPRIQTLDLDAGSVPSLDAWPPAEEIEPSSPMSAVLGARSAPQEAAMDPQAYLGAGPDAQLVKAVLANPALMDALARAVVAQLGDQTLREIAWEVMPELAEKLQRSS